MDDRRLTERKGRERHKRKWTEGVKERIEQKSSKFQENEKLAKNRS